MQVLSQGLSSLTQLSCKLSLNIPNNPHGKEGKKCGIGEDPGTGPVPRMIVDNS